MGDAAGQKVRDLFVAAMSLDASGRAELLDRECADDDAAIRTEVESLLEHHDSSRRSFDSPVVEPGHDGHDGEGSRPEASMPQRLGNYQIIDVLGEGGMGIVYRARQETPNRVVALKVIRASMASRALRSRFRHEAEILGRLQHPGIAQIFEAGSVDTGEGMQPYFAMELIEGQPLGRYAAAHDLPRRRRLELVASVCDAVHHAHQRGVIHRDLKPGNILVMDSGEPRILDFGIARVTDSDIRTTTLQTSVGQLIGTVPYMSPEQVVGDPAAIDVRSDVYALGVILFELLSGRLPHDLNEKTVPEAARIIRDEDPTRLSTLDRTLRGDVETIVRKALEKDVERRYQSAFDLASDLRRYLEGEPIQARPASTIYQVRKFAQRNRALVGGVAAAFAFLVIAVIGTTYGLVRATAAAERSANVNEFLRDMLTTPHPDRGGADVRLIDVADLSGANVAERFAGDPQQEALVRTMLGEMYDSQAMRKPALEQYTRAFELLLDQRGPDDPEVLMSKARCFQGMAYLGRTLEIEKEAPPWLDRMMRVLGPTHDATIITRREIAVAMPMRGRHAEAEAALRQLLDDIDAAGDDSEHGHNVRVALVRVLHARSVMAGTRAEAEGFLDQAIAATREAIDADSGRASGDDVRQSGSLLLLLSEMLGLRGRHEEAVEIAREMLARSQGRLDDNHTARLQAWAALASNLCETGELEEAADCSVRAVDGLLTKGPISNPRHFRYLAESLPILLEAERYEDGERLARLAVDTMGSISSTGSPGVYGLFLAGFLVGLDRHPEARALIDRVVADRPEQLAATDRVLLHTIHARVYAAEHRPAEAQAELAEARRILDSDPAAPRWLRAVVARPLSAE